MSDNQEKKVYYCPNCHKAFARTGESKQYCPLCNELMYNTNMLVSLWKITPDEHKDTYKKQWDKIDPKKEDQRKLDDIEQRKIETERQNLSLMSGQYEYDVETVMNAPTGEADGKSIKDMLNYKASKGWKLHTIYSNELGVNSSGVGIGGFGGSVNSTICEAVLVFERKIK